MTVADSGHAAVENRRWIASKLRAARFVEWDRFTVDERDGYQHVDVYGWIDRDDEYKDFVWARFWPATEYFEFTTSSAAYSERLSTLWFGEDGGHVKCRRVEDTFNVENAIALDREVADGD